MKNREYWNNRAEKLFNTIEKDEKEVQKKLAQYYKAESERLNKLIAEYYSKYGKDNVLQYRELLKKLSTSEKILLIEDIDTFVKKYPQYGHLQKVRETIYKLDRLEGLRLSVEMQQLELAEKEVETVKSYLEEVYKRGYDYAMKELGYGTSFNTVDKNIIEKFLNKAWVGGENFSDRIYANRDKVSKWIMNEFSDGIKRGDSYDRLIKDLMGRFEEVSKSSAKRLVVTEASHILNESSISVFEEEFEEYEFDATLDYRTSEECRSRNGKKYKIKDRKPGKNFPPMHPH